MNVLTKAGMLYLIVIMASCVVITAVFVAQIIEARPRKPAPVETPVLDSLEDIMLDAVANG